MEKILKNKNVNRNIEIYDTTLRDGTQGEGFSLSLDDKLMIADILDELGVQFIEGGYPLSNQKDNKFFELSSKKKYINSKITAFGSTKKKNCKASSDAGLLTLSDLDIKYVTIFGKSWDLHVKEILKASCEENLELIADSVDFLKQNGKVVFFDAEHFFDGFKNNEEYSVRTIQSALSSGAEKVVLCDTNGGTLPHEILNIINKLSDFYNIDVNRLGIHAHNDTDCAVANTLSAVLCGVSHVQGTINGYGERTGNANLSSIIPNLKLKLGLNCIPENKLKDLTKVSHLIDEISNNIPVKNKPYVGESAFAHKAGIHANAVLKNPSSYEHIDPSSVGNTRRFLISDLSGKGNIEAKAKELGFDLSRINEEQEKALLNKIKEMEDNGFNFESADGSFKMLLNKYSSEKYNNYFKLLSFKVVMEKNLLENAAECGENSYDILSEAAVTLNINGRIEHTAAFGNGPVNALDNALRKSLLRFYPVLNEMKLSDFKVRVINGRNMKSGTGSFVRVLIESSDKASKWTTIGVSENIIEASYQALADSINYKLIKENI